jgi:hypothetical protein
VFTARYALSPYVTHTSRPSRVKVAVNCQCITPSSPTQMISKIVPHSGTAKYLQITSISNYSLYMNTLLLVCGKCTVATTRKINVVHMGVNEFYTTVCRSQVLEELLIA